MTKPLVIKEGTYGLELFYGALSGLYNYNTLYIYRKSCACRFGILRTRVNLPNFDTVLKFDNSINFNHCEFTLGLKGIELSNLEWCRN